MKKRGTAPLRRGFLQIRKLCSESPNSFLAVNLPHLWSEDFGKRKVVALEVHQPEWIPRRVAVSEIAAVAAVDCLSLDAVEHVRLNIFESETCHLPVPQPT
eukprot:scaffold655_cov225-Pinguiococcus_pyrenoidosus.AAC.5